MDKKDYSFQITIYGNLTPFNDVISKARCRIFYKYGNRNGTYITDEFAEQLLSTIYYSPVKGIYDGLDYEDHGESRQEGKIYGVVPENCNMQWEQHLDEDGVTREYACVDVLLFTGLYKEASEIVNKSQSMELYGPSIEGEYQEIDGQKYFVFKKASFLGLQVLGNNIEPCFEGAAFFTLYKDLKDLLNEVNNSNFSIKQEAKKAMDKKLFILSHNEIDNKLFDKFNPDFNEDNGYKLSYCIMDVYDNFVIVMNYETGNFEKFSYEVKEDDSIELSENPEEVKQVWVTEDQYNKIKNMEEEGSNIFAKIDEMAQIIEDKDATITTLETEKVNLASQYEALQEDNETLRTYKKDSENKNKMQIIEKYSDKLSESITAKYKENLDNYEIVDLEKELAFQLVESNPSIFQKNQEGYYPKDDNPDDIGTLLSKYK